VFREVIILALAKCINIISMCIHEDTYIHTYTYIYIERERENFAKSFINGICPMHYPSYVCMPSYMKNAKLLQIPRMANRPPVSHGGREMGRKMRRIISLYCS
jgi:hypothetical protein